MKNNIRDINMLLTRALILVVSKPAAYNWNGKHMQRPLNDMEILSTVTRICSGVIHDISLYMR